MAAHAERIKEQAKKSYSGRDAEYMDAVSSVKFSYSDDGSYKNIEALTREDELDLLKRCFDEERDDFIGNKHRYVPMRRNTPDAISTAIGCEDLPMVMDAQKVNQALTPEGEIALNKGKGHGFDYDQLVSVT